MKKGTAVIQGPRGSTSDGSPAPFPARKLTLTGQVMVHVTEPGDVTFTSTANSSTDTSLTDLSKNYIVYKKNKFYDDLVNTIGITEWKIKDIWTDKVYQLNVCVD